MLERKVTGDAHPKTFTLVTDDADAELLALTDALDEVDASADDEHRIWLAAHTADQFREGVEVPPDTIGEFGDLLECAGFDDAAMVIERQREDAIRQAEAG